jgi:hypothetical protein
LSQIAFTHNIGTNLPAPINVSSTEQTKAGNLIIGGTLRLGQFTTANAPSGTEGALYFNTTEKKTKVYSNSAWGDLGGGGLWFASGTAAAFNQDVYIGGGLYVQGQRVICPAGQNGTDSYCNYVCLTYYIQTGTEGADSTEYCYNKTALTSANCGAIGGCKDSNYTNCNSQSNSTQQYACAQCKYIDTVNCVNNVLGSCTNYGTGTYCAYNGYNNGATNYYCSAGACLCDSSTYTSAPDGKDNDCDGTVDELQSYADICVPAVYGDTGNSRCAAYNATCLGTYNTQPCPKAGTQGCTGGPLQANSAVWCHQPQYY